MGLHARLQAIYDDLLVAACPTNGVDVPASVLRHYVNPTSYQYATTIRRFVGSGRRVLIVGAAGQRDFYFLAMAGKDVFAVDVARQALPRFTLGDARALPFQPARFDAVVAAEVIEHVVEDYEALREIRRVLRDDGALVLTVPYYHDAPEYHVRIHSPRSIERLLRASGFAPVEYIEKGGGTTVLERSRLYGYLVHGLNLALFRATGRTFYQPWNRWLAGLDARLGRRPYSRWHRWSCHYGAFIRCVKAAPLDVIAINRAHFAADAITG